VLFLDGDTELVPGWLERAIEVFDERPLVAGVTGVQRQLPLQATRHEDEASSEAPDRRVETVRHTGGSAVFRRSVLEEVGSFNPYLFSDEEPDLGIRIRHAGYELVRTSHQLLWEYTDPKGEWQTVVARWRRRLYVGAGQNLRLHLGKPTFKTYVRERGFGIVPLVLILGGLVATVWALWTSNIWLIPTMAGLAIAAFVTESIMRRSVSATLTSVVRRLAIAEGTVRGLFITTPESHEYEARFDVIQ
jgi:cellulose synthase/poly-beta-1,6-N-acetylglucosamine synthase-like glycosyltransferase